MSDVITERSNGILRVELNRPERKNALTASMYTSLAEYLEGGQRKMRRSVSCCGMAPEMPSAPATISRISSGTPEPGETPQGRLMDAFTGFEKPIVAAVQGLAVGGGTTTLTHCDFVYAGESAKFKLPFHRSRLGAGIRFELFDTGARRASPGGRNVYAGIAFHGRAGRRSSAS